jgi:hypothetical protein
MSVSGRGSIELRDDLEHLLERTGSSIRNEPEAADQRRHVGSIGGTRRRSSPKTYAPEAYPPTARPRRQARPAESAAGAHRPASARVAHLETQPRAHRVKVLGDGVRTGFGHLDQASERILPPTSAGGAWAS